MLKITTDYFNSGFFSCCSVRLHEIINYFNNYKKIPEEIDNSILFKFYKKDEIKDITFDYFENFKKFNNIEYSKYVNYYEYYQYSKYSLLDYDSILPFIKKYFTPSTEIINLISLLEIKYKIDYDNICVLFYRGNDKNTETQICNYDEYIVYAEKIVNENPNIQFLIQSDETEFIEKMLSIFPNNSFYFKDEIRHMKKQLNTVDRIMRDRIDFFSKYYLAITFVMSKCKYIICGSGNCSIWIMFFRGNAANVFQNLHGQWIEPQPPLCM